MTKSLQIPVSWLASFLIVIEFKAFKNNRFTTSPGILLYNFQINKTKLFHSRSHYLTAKTSLYQLTKYFEEVFLRARLCRNNKMSRTVLLFKLCYLLVTPTHSKLHGSLCRLKAKTTNKRRRNISLVGFITRHCLFSSFKP